MLSGYRSLLFILIFSFYCYGQTNYIEEFNYTPGNTITVLNSLWRISTGISPIVDFGNLSFFNYPSDLSTSSNKLYLQYTGIYQELEHSVTLVNSGTIYCAFLFQVTSLENVTDQSYFFQFANQTNNRASVFIHTIDNSTFNIGLQKKKGTGATFIDSTILYINQTYLVVISYTFVDGTYNDFCKIWINPELEGEEPYYTLYDKNNNDITSINKIVYILNSSTADMYIDAIRVATTWNDSALPVELEAFNAEVINNSVVLNWSTATEVNNYGFEVERSFDKSNWDCVKFVPGNGNSNRVIHYTYTDNQAAGSTVYYRLKQVDTDGSFTYSEVAEVKLGEMKYALHQNYPNPFNPETTIKYSITQRGFVNIKIYDMTGKEVKQLVNESMDSGEYSVKFNGSALPSGVYMYRIRVNGFVECRKMLLLK